MCDTELPPISGNWEPVTVSNTGPWTIGQTWIDCAASSYCIKVEEHHCNAVAAMHGGAVATFLDAQLIAVKLALPDPGKHTPTISLHVDYLAPVKAGDWLVAQVDLVKTTRTMIFTQAIARVSGRAMARSHAIYRNNAGKDFQ